ncbi:hypothetical protein M2271_007263 [Streptomyces sp. LBL]|uniref:hypothetical protein n=1 Tax=Streptomyces sp. LBL TaxID=2940562 RepID=UPI0024751352|nr:hypothetical protein [Streptomyces sp. LBL]MDH6629427.1 hypothetical protein [Streptomyces sp. LBL]
MRSYWTRPPVYDRTNPTHTGPLVVNYDLDQLEVGENRVVVGHKDGYDLHDRDIAPGDGWCRALYAPECTWPRGAHVCVLVEWHPDHKVGSDWDARLEAVTTSLRSMDYVVERAGQPINPAQDLRATLLVYRMEPGKTPPQRSADAWTHVPPLHTYTWRETNPLTQIGHSLRKTKAAQAGSRLVVRDIASALWPPEASFCAHVRWWPAPGTSSAEVHAGLSEFTSVARNADFRTRLQERPVPDAVESVDLLAYREAEVAPDRNGLDTRP